SARPGGAFADRPGFRRVAVWSRRHIVVLTRARGRTVRSRAGTVTNADVARILRATADLLELGGENPFRVRAYRNAARVIEGLTLPVAALAMRGPKLLDDLPGIG